MHLIGDDLCCWIAYLEFLYSGQVLDQESILVKTELYFLSYVPGKLGVAGQECFIHGINFSGSNSVEVYLGEYSQYTKGNVGVYNH